MRIPRADLFILFGFISLIVLGVQLFTKEPVDLICIAGELVTGLVFIPLGIHYYKRYHPWDFPR